MIDAICAFSRGGVVLWSFCFAKVPSSPFDHLIKNVLLEERSGSCSATLSPYTLQWKFLNNLEIVFVVIYRGIAQLAFLDALLDHTALAFVKHMDGKNALDFVASPPSTSFDEVFVKLFTCLHQQQKEKKMQVKAGGRSGGYKAKKKGGADGEDDEEGEGDDARGKKSSRRPMVPWCSNQRVTKKNMDALDFSKKSPHGELPNGDDAVARMERATYGADEALEESEDEEELLEVEMNEEAAAASGWFRSLTSKLQSFTGNKLLTNADIAEVLPAFRAHLAEKNVAEEVIDLLLHSVQSRLKGTRTASFTSVHQTVRMAMRDAIVKILTPKKTVDVLRLALEAKAEGRVFSIVFLGVNGVGKSTNLAKVAYYLKHKGNLDVLIAACDTFRAGAVEQLRTHSRCLQVPLFERGYGKDAAAIAREALATARQEGRDVVLIDTAGRMQDNEPLMRSLAKLVAMNSPDMILFVGEALVGNDAVDQLKKFNQALVDLTALGGRPPRTVDGIILTKFDTVDDKVGAALSMVYITGQPVVFVGTGQKYPNLKKLNPTMVVKALLD
ncbi:signal recognition particle receptor alpha subunit [Toxoplasma gondii TgCatPRC2]|uniref:Signal recognition particle receptor alpha subunit n=6 Tax=Toxoplasma gondii TaxID=5811 RepID=S7UTQ2_TOXGG|nr:signal recognition particle receptor alpha subunit [Toxoplasma gondii ME49]EPR61306.1 signal recognition particle receptor alpha subunit [Toxoplasma gondii GT1]KAF4642552.1 signal recognition particle receptor alpha subunit [Toxoplasma gondii]KFG36323.1 signal recognition particle receptor alpha subunit [Toxoplasma gondii FOU]KYF44606.1 signal recognition particle receptor alpha subunit [Toxoplasma gondii ARI]KYK63088.1 signal recognition particle receptor alpha subunit [Toxoplasma gondii T|eukprot:XP_018637209.1 signal recognition particle receptor alpha subunit [Toxoplasma gondii ME49]